MCLSVYKYMSIVLARFVCIQCCVSVLFDICVSAIFARYIVMCYIQHCCINVLFDICINYICQIYCHVFYSTVLCIGSI